MEIIIKTLDTDNIFTVKNYNHIEDKGQVSHFLAELKTIENDLIEIWQELNEVKDE